MTAPIEAPPLVSVIVPVRNGARTLGPCLTSVLGSDFPATRFEVIVVDNGSTDGTANVLRDFSGRVRVVHEARRGAAAARNAGLAAAEGTLVAFTDADCEVDSHWLGQLTGPLVDGEATVAGGRILAFADANTVARFGERIHDHRRAIEYFRPPYLITMNMAVTMEAMRGVGGFDERFLRGEDVDVSWRLLQAGVRLEYVDEAIVHHRNRDTLFSLAREAWQHGYYGVKVTHMHRAYLERPSAEYARRAIGPLPPFQYSRPLGPGREGFLRAWFGGFRRLGKAMGSRSATDLNSD